MHPTRRALLGSLAASPLLRTAPARADDKRVTVAINLSLTGAGAEDALVVLHGALLALEEANEAGGPGGPGGYHINIMTLDDGTAAAGQYDPAQAAVNARKMVADKSVVAAIGPTASGSGKAMAAILSAGNLATITPSSTNPDLTDPAFAAQYRPAGLPIYFRTCTTDAYQGPNMADYMSKVMKIQSVFVVDDSGAYGVGLADAFQARAAKRGMTILGRDRVDPVAADYSALMTKIKSLKPQALYCGAAALAGIKLVKQSYDAIPDTVKVGGDGFHNLSILTGAGFPAAQGWYSTVAAPHMLDDSVAQPWIERYQKRWNGLPSDYAITTYDAALVILQAIATVAKTGAPVTRAAVRDAIQAGRVQTLQGEIGFDANGDMDTRPVSVFQVQYDPKYPPGDIIHQFKYIGPAPAEES
jgi:branched-chain amino acid transport system substrate-binding protein